MNTQAARTGNILARIERLPPSKYLWKLIFQKILRHLESQARGPPNTKSENSEIQVNMK